MEAVMPRDTTVITPVGSQVDPRLAQALSSLGPWGAIAGLALTFGLPFVDGIIKNAHDGTPVTPETWAAERDKIKTPFKEL